MDKKFRIAFYAPDLKFGGAGRVVVNLLKGFARKNQFIVDLILFQKKGELIKDIPNEICIVELKVKSEYDAVLPLMKYMRANKPNVIFSNYLHISSLISKKLGFFNTKIVLIFHNFVNYDQRKKRKLKNYYLRKVLSKYLFKFADTFIIVSASLKNDVIEYYSLTEKKIVMINNPLELVEHNFEYPIAFNKMNGKKIIAVGRLVSEKNFILAIESVQSLLKEGENIHLFILGEGEERNNLQKHIDENNLGEYIHLMGYIEDVYSYMKYADLLIVTSITEGFCYVALEALACGCYIVTTDCGGIRDIIDSEQYGIIVEGNCSEKMKQKVLQALKKKSNKEEMISHAQKFRTENIVEQYTQLLFRLLEDYKK